MGVSPSSPNRAGSGGVISSTIPFFFSIFCATRFPKAVPHATFDSLVTIAYPSRPVTPSMPAAVSSITHQTVGRTFIIAITILGVGAIAQISAIGWLFFARFHVPPDNTAAGPAAPGTVPVPGFHRSPFRGGRLPSGGDRDGHGHSTAGASKAGTGLSLRPRPPARSGRLRAGRSRE